MATKISELGTGQKVGNILDETLLVGGGASTATTPTVTIPRETATTNTVEPVLRLRRTSSGAPANGIGASVEFQVETAAGNNEIGATIEAVTTDVTAGSEDFALVAKTMVAGSTTLVEGGRWVGAQYQAPSGTVSAPSYAFSAETNTGWYRVSGSFTALSIGGTAAFAVHSGGAAIGSASQYAFTSSGATNTRDTGLARNAAGVIRATDASTAIRGFLGGGAAVASAAALPVPTGRVFHVTGTTGITSITSTNFGSGCVITMIFDASLTVTHGNNIILAGAANFSATANDTLTMIYDGTNWYEVCRSVN